MKSLFGSKKAILDASLKLVVGLFLFGIIALLAYIFLTNFSTDIQASGFGSTQMTETANDFLGTMLLFDKFIVAIMVAGIIGIGYLGFRLFKPRIMFLSTVFGAVFLGFTSYIFNYAFGTYSSNTVFATVIGSFPLTIIICTNLHWIGLAGLVIGSLTLYAKKDDLETVRGGV